MNSTVENLEHWNRVITMIIVVGALVIGVLGVVSVYLERRIKTHTDRQILQLERQNSQMKDHLADRHLLDYQFIRLVNELSKRKSKYHIDYFFDGETEAYYKEFRKAFEQAGWDRGNISRSEDHEWRGTGVVVYPGKDKLSAETLFAALKEAGIDFSISNKKPYDDGVGILIGSKKPFDTK